jgi:hypothetical protein
MGGSGSTRWRNHQRAPLVEEALQLDVVAFEPALKHNQITGTIQWTDGQADDIMAPLTFSLGPISVSGTRVLIIDPGHDRREQSIRVERAQRGWHSGWLFRCPTDCGRRARKLYALPRWMVFSCRRCAGLTYKSAQRHDSRLDLARRDPEGFLASRARAPKTLNSQWVTVSLAERAQDPYRPGRGWGRRSTTSWSRMAAAMQREWEDRWGRPFPTLKNPLSNAGIDG